MVSGGPHEEPWMADRLCSRARVRTRGQKRRGRERREQAGRCSGEASQPQADSTAGSGDSVRPFRIEVPEAALADLKRRIAATRWPDKETVPDPSQGAQLTKLQGLVRARRGTSRPPWSCR